MKATVVLVSDAPRAEQQDLKAWFEHSAAYELLSIVASEVSPALLSALKPDILALDVRLGHPEQVESVIGTTLPRTDTATLFRAPFRLSVNGRRPSARAGADAGRPAPARPRARRSLLVVAASTGGPDALVDVLGRLPATFVPPILLVQHIGSGMDMSLVDGLRSRTGRDVRIAERNAPLVSGALHVAPSDTHLIVQRVQGSVVLGFSKAKPENSCRPAADVLFRSVAALMGEQTVALVLTGIGADGREGCRALRAKGAYILVQDKETAAVWGMPGAVTEAGLAHEQLALSSIGTRLASFPFAPLALGDLKC